MTIDRVFSSGGFTRIKVCGLTRLQDAQVALRSGADLLGIVFYPNSPRYLEPEAARRLLDSLRDEFGQERVRAVGVFVNTPAPELLDIVRIAGLSAVQLHGGESIEYVQSLGGSVPVIRALRVRNAASFEGLEDFLDFTSAFLFDAFTSGEYGGTGRTFPHDLARPWLSRHSVLIAGGLTPESVTDVISTLHPFGVDVSSGVEVSPGVKDPDRIEAFIRAVRRAESIPHSKGT